MVSYLCFKIDSPIDHHCKIQPEFPDLLEKKQKYMPLAHGIIDCSGFADSC